MSRCELKIELDDPGAGFRAGHPIRGHVMVTADTETRLRALRVRIVMRISGPSGSEETVGGMANLFSGQLDAGEEKRFAFELEAPHWPGAYAGISFQIAHEIEAIAEIPWAPDPVTAVPIRLIPDAVGWQPPVHSKDGGPGVWLVKSLGLLVPILFTFRFLGTKLLLVVPALLVSASVMLWLLLRWYPERRVGSSEFEILQQRLHPGDWLKGHLTVRPRRALSPELVSVRLTATEVCRTSKKEEGVERTEIYSRSLLALPARAVSFPGDQPTRFDLLGRIPPVAAYSMKEGQHELIWTVEAEVGIAGPIRWKRQVPIFIAPSTDAQQVLFAASTAGMFANLPDAEFELPLRELRGETPPSDEDDLPFGEAARLLWDHRHEPRELAKLIEAIVGLPFEITARVHRRSIRGGPQDFDLQPGEHVVTAEFLEPPLPLTLYVPRHLGDDFEGWIGEEWSGVAEVVGWDHSLGGLQLRVT